MSIVLEINGVEAHVVSIATDQVQELLNRWRQEDVLERSKAMSESRWGRTISEARLLREGVK